MGDAKDALAMAEGRKANAVEHPSHYTRGSIECIDALRAALGLDGFVAHCRACAIKYCWRAGLKDDLAQDLRKASFYLLRAAEEVEKRGVNG